MSDFPGGERVQGRVSIVTGASRGIGRAIAVQLGRDGGQVVVNYVGRESDARETAELIEQVGGKAVVEQADVRRMEDAERLLETALASFGRVDVVVNNAGITRDGLLMRMKEEDWDDVLDTNLRGAFHMIKAAARPMMKQRSGRIINITSVVGIVGNPGQANYVSAKAGLIGLTKSTAREFAPRGITVNAVAPGYIETEMTRELSGELTERMKEGIPLGRIGSPEDVAKAVAFLASEDAAYITGQVLAVDGGMVM